MLVDVHITEEGIEIKPVVKKRKRKLPFKESDLLEGLTSEKAHADELINPTDKELGE